ncbi:hypothetical protein CEQ90_20230 [Lewinellaceae bacterium SD302]|nr:hypothetical protein CEQ90_20230 [Lewinellaceae bacterium SD302]
MKIIILILPLFLINVVLSQKSDFNWLENIHSERVAEWIKEENERTEKFLSKCRKEFRGYSAVNKSSYVSTDYSYPEGKHFYRMMYNELNKPASLYYSNKIGGKEYLIVDPYDISRSDKIDIHQYEESHDGKYLAFSYGRNGSDWREIKIKKISGGYIKDVVKNVKFSSISWFGDGFFYQEYPRNGQFSAEDNPVIKYHRLKTDQANDIIVYRRESDKLIELEFNVLKSQDYLILTESLNNAEIINHYYIDLKDDKMFLRPLLPKLNKSIKVIHNEGEKLTFVTNHQSGVNRVNELLLSNPTEWSILIDRLEGSSLVWGKLVHNKLVCKYRNFLDEEIRIYDLFGNLLKQISFETGYTVNGFSEDGYTKNTLFTFGNEITPLIIYEMDISTFESNLVGKTKVTYNIEDYEILYEEYTSFDNTKVPITIIKRKDTELVDQNPTILKTYGGFGSVYVPRYDPGLMYFLDNGGVFAYAHVRGEGTLGEEWSKSGRGDLKTNTINDFLSAAEFLTKSGITSPSKLAITGTSHGGLIVAASFIKEPSKFKVAVPIVGVYDMLEFEKYTVGVFHTDEFGSNSTESGRNLLRSYSPFHNLKIDEDYPYCLIVTAENDDRVPAFQSYKFYEKMKALGYKSKTYLKVEKDAGHYGAYSINGSIEEFADIYSFILKYTSE